MIENSAQDGRGPQVSVLVPILNEERFLPETLPLMLGQDFDGELEFLLLDGGSDDGTLEILARFAAEDSRIRVLDNPGRRQSKALNLGLANANGDYVVRMDAHTYYPSDYVRVGVERLRAGDVAWVAGPQLAVGVDPWSNRIALAYSSPLGVGGARFRLPQEDESEADAAFTGVLRAETLRRLGGWNEDSLVNEDGELAARVRSGGGRIVCVPQMAARCVTRGSISGLARQYWRYGGDRAQTWKLHPRSLRRSHALPPALVLTALGALFGPRPLRRPARAGIALYTATLLLEALRRSRDAPAGDAAWLPLVFATMHVSWGSGFIVGAVRGRVE